MNGGVGSGRALVLGDRPALTGLRALAAVAVVAVHAGIPGIRGGAVGVTVFFALSGFLITTLALQELENGGRIDLLRFFGRRFLRLAPALALVVLGVIVLHFLGRVVGTDADGLAAALLYVSNWVRALTDHPMGMLGHTWSLSVEGQFYLLWPPLLWGGYRWRGRTGVLIAAVTLAAISLIVRLSLWGGPDSYSRIYNGTDTAADQLLWGCALATVAPQAAAGLRQQRWITAGGLSAVLLLGYVGHNSVALTREWMSWGYTALGISSSVLVAAVVANAPFTRVLAVRPIVWLGKMSYGVYLWHIPVILSMPSFLRQDPEWKLRFPLTLAVSLALAVGSYYLCEQPLQRRYRARFEVNRSSMLGEGHGPSVVALEARTNASQRGRQESCIPIDNSSKKSIDDAR